MPIRYKCEQCGATLKIKDELAGKRGKCPKCRTAFRVPEVRTPAPAATRVTEMEAEREAYQMLTEELSQPATATEREERPQQKKEEYFRSNPTDASNIASDLLALTGKKSQKSGDWRAALKTPFTPSKANQAYREYIRYYVGKTILVAVCCAAVLGGAWWVATHLLNSRGDLPDLGTVTGIVTLNGEPLARATIAFHPRPPKPGQSPAGSASFGRTDENGLYELEYVQNVPGAVLGKHRVEITPHSSSRVLLPSKYNDRSQLEVEVKEGKNFHNFTLKTKL